MCIRVHLKVLQGTWQMWVQYCGTQGRLAQMFRDARYLKVPLPLPVDKTEENQGFQHSRTFFSGLSVNWCQEGGFMALLSAGSKASLSPRQQRRASAAVGQGSPSSDSGRNLDQRSPNSREGLQVQCLAADTRIWPLSTTHEGREPIGE